MVKVTKFRLASHVDLDGVGYLQGVTINVMNNICYTIISQKCIAADSRCVGSPGSGFWPPTLIRSGNPDLLLYGAHTEVKTDPTVPHMWP